MIRHYNDLAGRGLDRIAALSDGVFAIAMTPSSSRYTFPTQPRSDQSKTSGARCSLSGRVF